jgi:hypothetical protein
MHYGLPVMVQHSWSEIPDLPFITPIVPTMSNFSHGPPQIYHGPDGPTSTGFYKGQPVELQGSYAPPWAGMADLPGCEDSWDEFVPSQFYSVNPGRPPGSAGQTPTSPSPQFVFGDVRFPLTLNMDIFWPTPPACGNEDQDQVSVPNAPVPAHGPSSLPLLPPLPSAPPTDRTSFSPTSQDDDPMTLACPTPPRSSSPPAYSGSQKGCQVTCVSPKRRSSAQRTFGRSPKKRANKKLEATTRDDGCVGAFS